MPDTTDGISAAAAAETEELDLQRLIALMRRATGLKLDDIDSPTKLAITILSRFYLKYANGLTSLLCEDQISVEDRFLLARFLADHDERTADSYTPLMALAKQVIATYEMAVEWVIRAVTYGDIHAILDRRPLDDIARWLALAIWDHRAQFQDVVAWLVCNAGNVLELDRMEHPDRTSERKIKPS